MLEPLDLHRGVSIVGKDVLFFNLESAGRLLGSSFLVHKFRVLSLQKLISVRTFAEFLVHEPILSCQRLNVLCQLCDLLGFELSELRLLVDLLLHGLALLAQCLDLLLPLEQFPLISILFAGSDAHLVLHIPELKALLLVQLLHLDQLLSLLVQIALHFVQVAVEHGNRLLKVVDLLVFSEQLSLVGLDVVEQNSFLILTAPRVCHRLLQPLQQLVLRVIQVLYQ